MAAKTNRRADPSPKEKTPVEAPAPSVFGPRIDTVLGARWFIPAVLGLAVALRLGHLVALLHTPWSSQLQLDYLSYDEWAQRIHAGDWLGKGVFFVDPLYAYFLAGIYSLVGRSLLVVRIVQLALGVGACYLTAVLGRRIFDRARGALACLIAALFIPSIYYEANIEKTALSVFLLTLSVVLFLGESRRAAFGAGICLGLAALARGNLLVFVPLGVVALLAPAAGGTWTASLRDRQTLRRAALFLAGALAIVGAAALRNAVAGGELVLTTANMGQNLYIGARRQNDSGTYRAPEFVRPDPRWEELDFKAEAERRAGRPLTASQTSAFWRTEALREIGAAPMTALGHGLRKLRLFWHNYEVPDSSDIYLIGEFSPVLRLPVVWMGALFPFALLGAIVTFRRSPRARLLTLAALVYCASVTAFFVVSRFRVQIVPILAVLAAAGVSWLWSAASRRRAALAAAGVCVVIAGFAYAVATPAWLEHDRAASRAVGYFNLGGQYMDSGDEDAAIAAFERAAATKPEAAVGALRALGDLYLKRKQFDKAEQRMRQVHELKPDSRMGRDALVRLYQTMLQDPAHSGDSEIRRKLAEVTGAAGETSTAAPPPAVAAASASPAGTVHEAPRAAPPAPATPAQAPPPSSTAAGGDAARAQQLYADVRRLRKEQRWSEAIAALQEAIRVGPYNEDAHYLLGSLMGAHAPADEMIAYFRGSVATDPKPQTSYYFWAVALERKGDWDGAVAMLRKALDVDPAHEMSEKEWGDILARQGKLEQALAHYQEAVAILPEYKAGQEACAEALRKLSRDKEAEEHLAAIRNIRPDSTKRYFYWGRRLAQKGRYEAAAAELRRALAADPNDRDARALLDQVSARGKAVQSLDDDARAAIVQGLSGQPPGQSVWFATDERDPNSIQLQRELEDLFVQAGWVVRGAHPAPFAMKAGLYLFAADDPAPASVGVIADALKAGGLTVKLASGYREYSTEMRKTKPDWKGFDLAADQAFVLVIGPNPR